MLAALVFVVAFSVVVAGQACLPVNSSALLFCQSYRPTSAYEDSSTASITATGSRAIRVYGTLSAAHTGASRTCVDLAARLVCSVVLRPCQSVGSQPVYSQPCSSVCSDFFNNNCSASWLTTLANPLVNATGFVLQALTAPCTALNPAGPLVGQPLYGDATWPTQPSSTLTTCVAYPVVPQNDQTFPCYPGYTPTNPNAPDGPNGYCERLCPSLAVDDIANHWLFNMVIFWVTWPVALVALILRLTIPKFSRYPANLMLLCLLGWFCVAGSISMQVFAGGYSTGNDGWRRALCTRNSVPGNQYNPQLCGLVGFGNVLGVNLFCWNWASIAVHSAVTVVLKRDPFNRATMIVSYLIGILVPLLFAVIPVGASQIAPLSTNPLCFPSLNYGNAVFYGVMGFTMLVSTIAFAIVLVKMLQVTEFSSVWSIRSNLRLVFFLVIQLLWAAVFMAYRFSFQTNLDNGTFGANVVAFYNCNFFAACSRYDQPGYALPSGWVWFFTVIHAMSGLAIVSMFCFQPELFTTPASERRLPFASLAEPASATTTTQASSTSSSGSAESTFMSDLN